MDVVRNFNNDEKVNLNSKSFFYLIWFLVFKLLKYILLLEMRLLR